MAHGLTQDDTMFSANRVRPWHGLGVILDGAPEGIDDALEKAGLDWGVEQRPVYVPTPVTLGETAGSLWGKTDLGPAVELAEDDRLFALIESDEWVANIRTDTEATLGIVGRRYAPVQNREAFEFVDNLIGSEMHFETAGSLWGGKRVWVLAKLPEHVEVGGDAIDQFVLLTTSHDGSHAVTAAVTPIRVVCQNTLTWGLAAARRTHKVRHTANATATVHEARAVLELSINYMDQFREFGDHLATQKMTEARFTKVLEELWPGEGTDRAAASHERSREAVMTLFRDGETVGNAPGTKWAAANAIAEYADWGRSFRNQDAFFHRAVADVGGWKNKAAQLVAVG